MLLALKHPPSPLQVGIGYHPQISASKLYVGGSGSLVDKQTHPQRDLGVTSPGSKIQGNPDHNIFDQPKAGDEVWPHVPNIHWLVDACLQSVVRW